MKKIATFAIALFISLSIIPCLSFAADSNLIEYMEIDLKSAETPKRLEIRFNLTESINLSQGNSNIIYEYFTSDSDGNLQAIYRKDRSWSGYLNSYDNYPSGAIKYSSGAEQANYPDAVPAARLYTSVKSSTSIDVTSVVAVRVTVLRANGSGEKAAIYSDGTVTDIEKIDVPVILEDASTGILLGSTTTELPSDTILVADEVTSGSTYETVSAILTDVRNFAVFEIKLESKGYEILPNGMVKISIPIPQHLDSSLLEVYRIDDNRGAVPYYSTITTQDGVEYATFETDHFSIYVLAEVVKTSK